jgi:hypothetical protein
MVPKKSTISASSADVVLVASITASAPRSAASSPSPVYASTPALRLTGTVWWPSRSSVSTVSCPILPVAPATAIRMRVVSSYRGPRASWTRGSALVPSGRQSSPGSRIFSAPLMDA